MYTVAILCLTLSSPAPPPKVKVVPQVVPGRYVLEWGSSQWHMELRPNGEYVCAADLDREPMNRFIGSWHWDRESRTLRVSETSTKAIYYDWFVALDGDLKGQARYDDRDHTTKVSLRKIKPIVAELSRQAGD